PTPSRSLSPYTTLFRSAHFFPREIGRETRPTRPIRLSLYASKSYERTGPQTIRQTRPQEVQYPVIAPPSMTPAPVPEKSRCRPRSEEHTSELQSRSHVV